MMKDLAQAITSATKELRTEHGDDLAKVVETRDGGTTAAARLEKLVSDPGATPADLTYAMQDLLSGKK